MFAVRLPCFAEIVADARRVSARHLSHIANNILCILYYVKEWLPLSNDDRRTDKNRPHASVYLGEPITHIAETRADITSPPAVAEAVAVVAAAVACYCPNREYDK